MNEINVGKCLHDLRLMRNLSLRKLAEMSGLNVNTLSLIENAHTSPSVSTLQQLAKALQVPITSFFESPASGRKVIHQKIEQRPYALLTHGSVEDLGAGTIGSGLEPLIINLHPHAEGGERPISHSGWELIYCLEGKLASTINGDTYLLEAGDSLLYDASLLHIWRNPEDSPSRNLLIFCRADVHEQIESSQFQKFHRIP